MFPKMRKARFETVSGQLIYDTHIDGPWTIESINLTAPERKTNIVDVPGRHGAIDLAPALTDGEPRYKMRTLSLTLVCSVGRREERLELVRAAASRLGGRYCRIFLPDSPDFYLAGYVDVREEVNDINRAVMTITASVEPYFEARHWTLLDLAAKSNEQSVIIKNRGGRRVIPALSAYVPQGGTPAITVRVSSFTIELTNGVAVYPEELAMSHLGEQLITYSGRGHLVISWQEARLL